MLVGDLLGTATVVVAAGVGGYCASSGNCAAKSGEGSSQTAPVVVASSPTTTATIFPATGPTTTTMTASTPTLPPTVDGPNSTTLRQIQDLGTLRCGIPVPPDAGFLLGLAVSNGVMDFNVNLVRKICPTVSVASVVW